MKAVLFDIKLSFVDSLPVPSPGEGEALIKVLVAGICNTDLEIIKGYMGFKGVIGHEFVGVVEQSGEPGLMGKRVVGDINLSCGRCDYCLNGLKTHCPERTVLGIYKKDGSMAEYLTLPVKNLHIVPDNVSDEEAVFTEPLAAAFEILEQVRVRPADKVLVMGDGKLGILCALVMRLSNADVTLLGKHEDKLAIAANQGVRTILKKDMEYGRAYDVVVEATGSKEGFTEALRLVKPRGTIVLKSTVAEGGNINLSPVVVDEITVLGSRCGPFGPALRLLSENKIDVRPLITGVYGFEDAPAAFEKAREKGSLKVLLDFRTKQT